MKKIIAIIVLVIAAAGFVLIMRKPASQTAASPTPNIAESSVANQITISNYKFLPEKMTVKVGTTVTWLNKDIAKHNIAFDDTTMNTSGPLFGKDQTFTYTFTKAGTFGYHCEPHPYMKASIEVTQ